MRAARVFVRAVMVCCSCFAVAVSNPAQAQSVVINEIMYNPPGGVTDEEFIEIYNPGPTAVNLGGWDLNGGVDFEFPPIILNPGGYLVVTDNLTSFSAKYPAVTSIVGNWDGKLRNGGERVELRDPANTVVDWVEYADEGEWAQREEGPLDRGHRGWVWGNDHDGGGKSLELINAALPNECGQNWGASLGDGGTPGQANSIAAADIAPLIVEIERLPLIANSGQPVSITARLVDEAIAGLSLTVHYRLDGAPVFAATPMLDDGSSGDGAAGDGVFGASMPGQSIGAIVEYYLEASDGTHVRTLPAPSLVGGVPRQVTNFLYLVDDNSLTTVVLPRGSGWRYLDDGSNQGVAWRDELFNDSSWSSGPAQLGYGDGDEATLVGYGPDAINKHITTYFRSTFEIADTSQITGLIVRLLRDDGVVVYINGDEAFRDNITTGAYNYLTTADRSLGGTDESTFFNYRADPALLVNGANVIAVEIHQAAPDSADISFDLELAATLSSSGPVWTTGSQPLYHIIMTGAERAELADIGDGGGGEQESNAQMNATFISLDELGVQVRYNVSVRNRGAGSRLGPPNNYRVNFRHDRPWEDVTRVNINCRYPYSQLSGSLIWNLAGIEAANARVVQTRVNGVDLAEAGVRMYGSYVHVEVLDADFVDDHFRDNNGGNVYAARDDESTGEEAELQYEGTNPDNYRDTYFKNTNETEDDYTDLIALTNALNNSPSQGYHDAVDQVLVVDEWVRYLALDTLLGNREGGLNTGKGDDYALYRGTTDPRFVLVPHDLDTILGQGGTTPQPGQSIFTFRNITGLNPFLNDPQIVQKYYRAFFDHIDTFYNPRTIDPLLDAALGDWVPQARIDEMKQFLVDRTNACLAQIPQAFTINSDLPMVDGYLRTTDPFAVLYGDAHAAYTGSVLLNGVRAQWDPITGQWSIGQQTGPGTTGEIIIPRGSEWRYLDDGSDQGTTWTEPAFPDGAWGLGFAQFGYGDSDETTVIGYGPDQYDKYITTYFRKTISIPDASKYSGLTVRLMRDDGAIVFINGTEYRSHMPTGPVDYLTPADPPAVGGADESTYYEIAADPADLVDGTNIIAVELHQVSGTSSDVSFDLELEGLIPGAGGAVSGVPLNPGINRVVVEAFEGPNGTGAVVDRGFIDIWYAGTGVEIDQLDVVVRDSYLPGIPILVRAMALDGGGNVDREVWNATVNLTADQPGITLNPNQIRMYNGMGCALVTVTGSGDFTLTASVGTLSADRPLVDLSGVPMTTASGTLPGTTTDWAGIIHVTGDLLVPTGHTLTIQPGTLILLDGVASGDTGTDFDVVGEVQSLGTRLDPVTFTAFDPARAWGEIHHDGAAPSLYQYTHIHRAGNSPTGGHTNTGPTFRPVNSTVTFENVTMTDAVGKIMQAQGSDLVFRDCHMARAIMGPEIDGTALLMERTWITEMFGPNDDDGIYIHSQSAGQTVWMRDGVIADGDDDALDTLGSDVNVENYVFRDFFDKGVSVFGGETSMTQALIVDNGIGVSQKETGTAHSRTNIDHATIVGSSIGIQNYDKTGEPNVFLEIYMTNSIIWDCPDPVYTDYDPADIHIDYSDVGEAWPGTGDLNADPWFVNPASNDYRLSSGSLCLDAGDPAFPLDPDGSRTDMGYFTGAGDISTSLSGTLAGDTVLRAGDGPYFIPADLIVPVGVTLTIDPGTTLFFYPGTRILVYGRLVSAGTEYKQIRFTSVPGMADWGGCQFLDTTEDNILKYTVLEYAATDDGMVHVENSKLEIDRCAFDNTARRRIVTLDSSLVVRNSLFTDTTPPAVPPPTDNLSEHIYGRGILTGGELIIQGNTFGTTKGHNDAIDLGGGQRPGPIPQILDNVFTGGGDEALDLACDAHIEGNTFRNYRKDAWNTSPGESNVISAGDGYDYVVARNTFVNFDHAVLVKDDSYLNFENNTLVDSQLSDIYFDVPGQTQGPGRGADVDGCIFWNSALPFDQVGTASLTVNRSAVPTAYLGLGIGNTDLGPNFDDPSEDDFSLAPPSPCIGTGPNGLDMGALVPPGASIGGEPPRFTIVRDAILTIDGPGITHYRYSLDGAAFGPETPIDTPIPLSALADGDHQVVVFGKNSAGVWQAEPTESKTWTINPTNTTLVVSEVMFNPTGSAEYEFIEFHNTSPDMSVNLGIMTFTNGITYKFPVGAAVKPNGYVLVVPADTKGGFKGFRARYGLDDSVRIYGSYTGRLRDEGERVTLETLSAQRILSFEYNDGRGWPVPADGAGHSLVPLNTTVQPVSSLDYGGNWRFSTYVGGSPGEADPPYVPTVVINEVMANTTLNDPQYPQHDSNDWIELYNVGSSPVNLTNWYLSDERHFLNKWAIYTTATVPAGGRLVFDEINDFHNPIWNGFGVDRTGERLFLSYLPGTAEDRVVDALRFKGQEAGVSLCRHPDGDRYRYKADPSRDAGNTPPHEHVVIREFMFHPADDTTATEYIELYNPTAQTIDLWNAHGTYRLDGGVDYYFPPGVSIAPGSSLLILNIDPLDSVAINAFKATYGIGSFQVSVHGPYYGNLSNKGERFALERPMEHDPWGQPIGWVIVDEVIYFDRAPWTTQADGTGLALHRISTDISGNDPNNWVAAAPSPGDGSAAQTYPLTVLATNGTVQKVPDQASYIAGSQVVLTPQPDPDFFFVGWTGDVPIGHEMDNPLTLTMNAARNVTANFLLRPPDAPDLAPEPPYWHGTDNVIVGTVPARAVDCYAEWATDPAFLPGTIVGNSGWFPAPGPDYQYTATGLADGVTYYYRVRARNSIGLWSPWSAVTGCTQDASPPESRVLPLPASTTNQLLTIESESSDSGSGVDEVRLYYRRGGSGAFTQWQTVFTSNTLQFDASLTGGPGFYEFYTRALDVGGNIEAAPAAADAQTLVMEPRNRAVRWELYR